ncbi:MAG: helix-turn-helix transcriptional regulator [Elusimicrobiota bacterium]|jgi:transcriptional regulator with XRE-family HTH domain
MAKRRTHETEIYALNRAVAVLSREGAALSALPWSAAVRTLRTRLRMTQAQLARRAGVPQPQIARIESGRGGVRMDTLQRVFSAMFCDALVLPLPRRDLDAVVDERLRASARRRAASGLRSLAHERHAPAQDMAMHLVRFEEQRLRLKDSPLDWDELA